MSRRLGLVLSLWIAAGAAIAGEPRAPEVAATDKKLSGMSVLGNDDAPKSLVIVPWRSSVLGDTLNVPRALDEGPQPVDRDVFARELAYYRIRSESPATPSPPAR
jgi:hypothetical protein